MMAMTIRPTKMPATTFMRKTITAIITVRAIIPTAISTIAFHNPITAPDYVIRRLINVLGMKPASFITRWLQVLALSLLTFP